MDFYSVIGTLARIKSVRINAIVGFAFIEFDARKLSYSFWEKMQQLRNKPQHTQ